MFLNQRIKLARFFVVFVMFIARKCLFVKNVLFRNIYKFKLMWTQTECMFFLPYRRAN